MLLKLGRISKKTRGPMIPGFVEDLLLLSPGDMWPHPGRAAAASA